MIFSRASFWRATRLSQPLSSSSRRTTLRTSWQSIKRRTYATAGEGEGHSAHKSSSDWPWAITSAIITIPSVYILIQPQLKPKKSHGHDHHEGGHGEHDEKAEEGTESESSHDGEANSDDQGASGDGGDEGGANSAENAESGGDEGQGAEASESDGGEDEDGTQNSGNQYGKKQGVATSDEQDPEGKDLAAASKPAGNVGNPTTQSAKQEGLSNADTKYSVDIKEAGQSIKGEGIPETAKSKGTVDPFRPQK